MILPKLSSLTPDIVDTIYGTNVAPSMDSPVFIFLIGAPGSGKSSGHAHAISEGILGEEHYATINLDSLLESLVSFRAASAMAHFLHEKFSPIGAYGSSRENLGLFNWYNDRHTTLERRDPETVHAFNRIRDQFVNATAAPAKLTQITAAALERAIEKRINIVYETTLFLNSAGRVNKVDTLMHMLQPTPYRVFFYHITGSVKDIAQRLRARQEIAQPQELYPFYRYVPASDKEVAAQIAMITKAYNKIQKQYSDRATFTEIDNPYDVGRVPPLNRRSTSTRRRRIMSAYGPSIRRKTSSNRPSLYVSDYRSDTNSRRRI